MTSSIAMLGDLTSHGGRIITASTTRKVEGNFVARFGDICTCPIHGITMITTITQVMPVTDSRLTAHDGAKTACGATILRNPFNSIQGEGTSIFMMDKTTISVMDALTNGALTSPISNTINEIKNEIDQLIEVEIPRNGLSITQQNKLNSINPMLNDLKQSSIEFDTHSQNTVAQIVNKSSILSSIKGVNTAKDQQTNTDDYFGSISNLGISKTNDIKQSLTKISDYSNTLMTQTQELNDTNTSIKQQIQNSSLSAEEKLLFNDFNNEEPSYRNDTLSTIIHQQPSGTLKNNLSQLLSTMNQNDQSINGMIDGMELEKSKLVLYDNDITEMKNNEIQNFDQALMTLEKASSASNLQALYKNDSSVKKILNGISSDDFIKTISN